MKHLPNILTSLRIIAAGVFAFFFAKHKYVICAVSFAVSMITDVLDGFIARSFNCISDLGKILDPVADKITLLTISACFFSAGWIPRIMLFAVILKESLMLLGGLIMLRAKVVAYSDLFGKASTALFSLSIVMMMLEQMPIPGWLGSLCSLGTAIFGLSVICSFIALGHYLKTQFLDRVQ